MSNQEMTDLRGYFATLDKNRDGRITVSELSRAMSNCGLSQSANELEALVKDIDVDGDGKIDVQEFLAASMLHNKMLKEDRIREAFDTFDTDKTGVLSFDNLKTALLTYVPGRVRTPGSQQPPQLSVKKIRALSERTNDKLTRDILEVLDTVDETIDYDEFRSLLLSRGASKDSHSRTESELSELCKSADSIHIAGIDARFD